MKTNPHETTRKFWLSAATGFALIVLAVCPQRAVAQTNTFPNSGNVGIGTTVPDTKLQIFSSSTNTNLAGLQLVDIPLALRNTSSTNNNLSLISLQDAAGYGNVVLGGIQTNQTNHSGEFFVMTRNGGAIGERLRVSSAGNVGIGTAAPSSKLHIVSGSDSPNTLLSLDTGVHGGSQFQIGGTANNESYFNLNVYRAGVYTTRFSVSNFGHVLLQPGGDSNVGVGTSSPGFKLDVQGGQVNTSGGLCIAGDCKTAWSQVGGSQWTNGSNSISYSAGNVGIGTPSPTVKLHIVGDGKVTGNLTVDGNIAAKYQDVAEWVPAVAQLPTGTVVVLDPTKSNHVTQSTEAYDTRVAGVISAQPGIALGESGANKVLVATTGRVLVKVDASRGPIHVGDLLVTSDTPGLAMKSEPIKVGGRLLHMPGTLIGKALEPLEKGSGKILVLLSLQ